MTRITKRGLALTGLLLFSTTPAALAQGGFLGFGGDDQNPSLRIRPAEIAIDVPMPVNSASLAMLLAQAGEGGNLSSMKDAALRKYRTYLEIALNAQLQAFFVEEEIPLVDREGLLSLHNQLNVKVVKHFSTLQSTDGVDLESGTIEVGGEFHYALRSFNDRLLRERKLDIAKMKIHQEYRVKSSGNGSATEDNTEEAIKLALSKLVEEILDEIEDDLEADELRDLLSG
ncbi:hypothetical protein SAMN04487965_1859 [Microbulbifer donghaiensis]|uniref:Lipoprotein n=1 Tax=Microbulbifer donghaiensis TaxID=494016 RepID=A0A1M5AGP4_9GAMM|nr:hypothetical protein [Microbulbifer donghaiensis]SHF29451.1 hypothetical protein SAMN04487965_1859 [Microbulbifer donghaiensis]